MSYKLFINIFAWAIASFTIIGAIFISWRLLEPNHPEAPGNLSNPKLVAIFNKEIELWYHRVSNSSFSIGILPTGKEATESWLNEIDNVVATCEKGSRIHERFNKIQYHITLISGEKLISNYGGERCYYDEFRTPPLVMKVLFKNGQVIDVKTDGRELKHSVEMVKSPIANLVSGILYKDRDRNRDKYYAPSKTEQQIKEEWKK